MAGSLRALNDEKTKWEIRLYLGRDPVTGKRRDLSRTFYGTHRDADQEMAKLYVEHSLPARSKQVTTSVTVEELLSEWLELARLDLRPKTAFEYAARIRRDIIPTIGSVPAAELRPSTIDRLYRSLVVGGLSPASVRQTHAILRRAFNQAVKWDWVDVNPVLRATPPRLAPRETTAPTVEQLAAIIEDAAAMNPQWPNLIGLAALTGMRRGEIVALRWADLDADGTALTVRRSITHTPQGYHVTLPKTHRTRRVMLDDSARRFIRSQSSVFMDARTRAGLGNVNPSLDAFVFFGSPSGMEPIYPDSISQAFRKLADRHGWRELHFHTLRHFNATQLIAAGVDVRTVASRLGHASPSVTLNVYSHAVESANAAAAEVMGRLIGGDASK